MEFSDINIKFILPVLSFIFSLYGVYHYINNHEHNQCEMTYMFEYPEYLKIPLKYDVMKKFPRYNLYLYGEGKYFEDLESGKLSGVPVLFIPGNAGSHRQVRSLGSVALRMGHSLHSPVHFNFFSIDFHEEISALYGGTLNEQTEFVSAAMRHIKSLYPRETKIILIGHSMGGVIGKAVFSLSSFDPSDVSLLLTLSAPLREPVIALDSSLVDFYKKIEETWKFRLKEGLKDISFVTIGGGERDILVRSDLTCNNFQQKSEKDIHSVTTAIPGVWLSTDHLAITWCKQLVLSVCRSLFDLTNKQTKQISASDSEISKVLNHHFVKKIAGTHNPKIPSIPLSTFPASAQWIEQENRAWRFSRSKVLSTIHLLIPVTAGDDIIVVASGLVKQDWIYGCVKLSGAETKTCNEGENLSEMGEIIPSKNKKHERRMIHLSKELLHSKSYFYILIYIPPVNSQVDILGESYISSERKKNQALPSLLSRYFQSPTIKILSVSLPEQLVFYNVTISQSHGVFESAEFQLETRLCRAGSVVGQGLIRLEVPGTNEISYHHIRTSLGGVINIPVNSDFLPKPYSKQDVNLQLILDPECSIVLTAKFPVYIIASQFIKFYGVYVVGYTVSLLFAFLAGQMFCFERSGSFLPVLKIFGYYPTYLSLVAVPTVLYHCLLSPNYRFPFIIPADRVIMYHQSIISTLCLRTILYLVGCGLIISIYIVTVFLLKLLSKTWLWMRHSDAILKVTEIPLEQMSKAPLKISKKLLGWCALLGAFSILFSSSLGLLLAAVSYFIMLASLHMRCTAEEERRGPGVATSKWYIHFSLVLLWMFAVPLVVPGFISWVKCLDFTLRVPNDPYTWPCVLMLLSCSLMWQLPTPCFSRIGYKTASHAIHIIATLTTLYAISSIYRLLYSISLVFFIVSLQQTYAYYHGILGAKLD